MPEISKAALIFFSVPSTRARVQAHRLSSVLALHEGIPRAMDHHSWGCLPVVKFPTFASGRQGRGPVRLLGFHHQFHLTTLRDVAQEEFWLPRLLLKRGASETQVSANGCPEEVRDSEVPASPSPGTRLSHPHPEP
jgi:hypothetical protein